MNRNEKLTRDEALAIADILERWPGGLGCVLIKDETQKRGYRKANWGFHSQGKFIGDFDYSHLDLLEGELLYCPVTQIGRMREAQNYTDHNICYAWLIEALIEVTCISESMAKDWYNRFLKSNPKDLAAFFRLYAEGVKFSETVWYDELMTKTYTGVPNLSKKAS
jgi:hypothetical protein